MGYKNGLQILRSRLPNSARGDYEIYELRLLENLDAEQRYGTTEIIRAERVRIIEALNQFTQMHLGVSFSDMCLSEEQLKELDEKVSKLSIENVLNPFGVVGRIKDPTNLFGRDELIRQLFEELKKGCNRSLVGASQIGKSSILSAVCALGPERLRLPHDAFIYLDMQVIRDEDDFFEALCDGLKISTCRGFRLARALRGKRYILCIDEIEKMAKDRFTGDEREELRGLADGDDAPFKIIIASRIPLDQLFPDALGRTSPLANIFPQIDVPLFTYDIGRAFITHKLKGTGITFTSTEIEKLLSSTGGHPARLQQAAADLFNRRRRIIR